MWGVHGGDGMRALKQESVIGGVALWASKLGHALVDEREQLVPIGHRGEGERELLVLCTALADATHPSAGG